MKKKNHLIALGLLLLASALIFSACSSDDNDNNSDNQGDTVNAPKVTVVTKDVSSFGETTELSLENYAYKVTFNIPINVGEKWTADIAYAENDFYTETDDNGNTVDTDVVYQLGYLSATEGGLAYEEEQGTKDRAATETVGGTNSVNLYVYRNDVAAAHSATLTIAYGATGTETKKVITLEQKAAAENADADESVAMKQFIGYGYNTRLGYASILCRKNPIFKVTELMSDGIEYEGDTVKIIYTTDKTGLAYREASGANTAELEASLKLSVEGNAEFCDFSTEIDAHTEWTHKSETNYQYAWADIKVNKLTAVINTDDLTLTKKEFMTDAAYKAINGLNPRYKGNTADVFKRLVKQYGTHVVKGGILGGKVHLGMEANTEKMEGTFEAGGMLKAGYDGLFKLEGTTEGSYKNTLTKEGSRFTFSSTVSGGSEDAVTKFGDLLNERTASESSRSDKFAEWQTTLSEANNCVFIDFVSPKDNLIPLYELLDDELDGFEARYDEMKKYFEGQLTVDYPIEGQARYVKTLPAKIDTSKITFDENGSYVKDIYYGDSLVARLCWEYIPQINMNSRVKVLYPADNNGKVFWNAGLYAGDMIQKPQSVGWNGGNVVLTEKSSLNYDQYTTFYLTGTTLTTYTPTYLSQEDQNKIEALSSRVSSADYTASIGGGTYNMVKIENNLYTRDFFNNAVFKDGKAMANIDGSSATPIADEIEVKSGEKKPLADAYKNVHYYPLWLFTEKWDSHGGFIDTTQYTIPTTSAITSLASRLSALSRKPGGTVAAMFMKGGALGLNLTKTGYIGYNTSTGSNERYYFDQGDSCILGCWDDSDNTTGLSEMRSKAWNNLTKITISPTSGGVSRTDYTNMQHEYRDNLGWVKYCRESVSELRSEMAPCYRLIICQPCK